MKREKRFEGLLRSEIKKVNRFVQKRDGRDSQITGYSYCRIPDELGFVRVRCEICSNDMNDREDDAFLYVFMKDRRMSFASNN